MFDDVNPEAIRGVVRLIWIIVVGASCLTTNLIARQIGNRRLKKLIMRISAALGVFIALLASSVLIDNFMQFRVAYLTSSVNILFWSYILFVLIRFCLRLKNDNAEIQITGGNSVPNPKFINKTKLSVLLDEMFNEIQYNIAKTDKLERQMKRELTKHLLI